MANPFWSESQELKLLKMASAGSSMMEMAMEFGKSSDAVRSKLVRLERDGRQPVSEEVREEVVEFENVALKSGSEGEGSRVSGEVRCGRGRCGHARVGG